MALPLYLDCNASNPVLPELAEILYQVMRHQTGNTQAEHSWGRAARELVEQARQQLAAVAHMPGHGVIFTSGATESNQLAVAGLEAYGESLQQQGRRPHAIASAIEHPSVLAPLKRLQHRGWALDFLPCAADGRTKVDPLPQLLRPDTVLLSLMAANNETGVVQPLETVAHILRGHSLYWHCDASQGFARIPLPPRIDMVSISAHKMYAPIGVGALLLRPRWKGSSARLPLLRPWLGDGASPWPPLTPILLGGGQQGGMRSGSLPFPLIHAMGHAAQSLHQHATEWQHRNLRTKQKWLELLQPLGATLHGAVEHSLGHVLNFSLKQVNADTLLFHCRDLFVAGRGSACSEGGDSQVLQQMGRSQRQRQGAVRLSWCHFTPEPAWPTIAHRLRQLTDTLV